MANQAMSRMTLVDLPEHMLNCIIRLIKQDALQPNSDADGIAALRCVCQSLRHAVDATMTQAVLHTHLGADELDDVLRSRTGSSVLLRDTTLSTLWAAHQHPVAMATALKHWLQCISQTSCFGMIFFQACEASSCSSKSTPKTLL